MTSAALNPVAAHSVSGADLNVCWDVLHASALISVFIMNVHQRVILKFWACFPVRSRNGNILFQLQVCFSSRVSVPFSCLQMQAAGPELRWQL